MVNWPQQGYRQAGKEKRRLEDLLHMSTRSQLGGQWELGQHCSRCSLGLDAACVHGPAKHFRVTGCGTQRDSCPVLCILTT